MLIPALFLHCCEEPKIRPYSAASKGLFWISSGGGVVQGSVKEFMKDGKSVSLKASGQKRVWAVCLGV